MSARIPPQVDAVVIGAGFAGMYMLYRLRQLGLAVQGFEAGGGVGGTWYWNRYPGARCDNPSIDYSYSFSDELQQEWRWTEKYAGQPEILRYANHVADRFDLRKDIMFETRIVSATYDEEIKTWLVVTDRGERIEARYCVMATGCLSMPNIPSFPGKDRFLGECYHTGQWPHEGVSFAGKSVGMIGTGATGIQAAPIIAQQAKHLYVFQRMPHFTLPARNGPLDPAHERSIKANYQERRRQSRASPGGQVFEPDEGSALAAEHDQRQRTYEWRWNLGGQTIANSYNDLLKSRQANETVAEFVRTKIQSIVKDPATANLLCPRDYPFAAKRLSLDSGYYETYNRPNVTLVDVRSSPIEEIVPTGIRTRNAEYAVDCIVFATGFDAMTGALSKIEIRGKGGRRLREEWSGGPRTYLGLMVAGFPNLFTITGPGSPSVLASMILGIEQHVDWIAQCIQTLETQNFASIEANEAAQSAWVEHVNEVADSTVFPLADSWYVGANIPGKPRVFMPYIGGFPNYIKKCEQVVANDYEGFTRS